MKSTTSLRLLVLAVIATPLLAIWIQDPDPDKVDWQKHVRMACESRRYGIRLAAARKLGAGGDAAVPAIRAYIAKNGKDKLPDSLVNQIADGKVQGDETVALLLEWAEDRDFYWRSAAMRGLALRGPAVHPADRLRAVFIKYQDDPAWLMRTHARFGSALLDDSRAMHLPEPDPRARVRLTTLLLEHGVVGPLDALFAALADERTFLGVPWGPRMAAEAHKTLKTWLGDEHPLANGGAFDDKAKAIEALRAAAKKKSGVDIKLPVTRTDAGDAASGGIEILSCKYGDQFLQWTEDGTLRFGIAGDKLVELPADVWRELQQQRTSLALDKSLGVVICDSLRVRLDEPDVHIKVAPDSLPKPATDWLKRLAQTLEEVGETELAAHLRRGLGQFAGR